MKRKRRLSGVLLIIAALIIMQLPVSEADAATSASDFKMEGTTLVEYRGTEKNVSVPDTVEVIGEGAFEDNDDIERVVLSKSVKRIDAYAFWGCDNLETVVLGTGMTEIGDYSFAYCKGIEYMTIPKNIKSIGIKAFVDCVNMTDITIPTEVTTIHETSFDGCRKLYIECEVGSVAYYYALDFYERQEEMPEYEDVPGYQTPDESDESTDEDNQDISNAPESIGTMLGSTHVVGNHAFVFMNNTDLNVFDSGKDESGETADETLENVFLETDLGVLPKYTIVDGRIVADQAYYRNNTLKNIVLPVGIEEIGQFAFSRSSAESIVIPEGVKNICYGAFYHCDNLTGISLPTTIVNVEPKAFAHSGWVEDFENNGTDDFLISGNVLIAYRGNGGEVNIPEGVTVIAGEAFMNETRIESVTFPESLLTIGEGAFEGCSELTRIQTGASLSQIKDRAFAECPLVTVELPASVKEIGLKAFEETVTINYEGNQTPEITHETTAERLSNEVYRNVAEEIGKSGVMVSGIAPAMAKLEGAKRSYTLSVTLAKDKTAMKDAYQRCFETGIPKTMTVYDMQLTDNSGIPLTKLGKQKLTITIPVPKMLKGENVVLYSLDRNGQLERLVSERVLLDGEDAIRFQTNQLSLFGVCGDGSVYDGGEVMQVSSTLNSMSAAPEKSGVGRDRNNYINLKWIVGIGLLMTGSILVLSKRRTEKYK